MATQEPTISSSTSVVRPSEGELQTSSPTGPRVAANVLFQGLGTLVNLGHHVVTVPLFLAAWGDALYGDWLTITAAASYLTLSDLGMQSYVNNRLVQHAVRHDWNAFRTVAHSAIKLYLILSLIASLLLVAAVAGMPWATWFRGRPLSSPDAPLLLLVSGLYILAAVASGFLVALYRAFGRPELSSALSALARGGVLILTCILLLARAAPLAIASFQLIVTVIFSFILKRQLERQHPEARLGIRDANWHIARSLIAPSLLFFGMTLGTGLVIQGVPLAVSVIAGATAVTTFVTTRTLANIARQLVSLLSSGIWPELTRLDALGARRTFALAHALLVKTSSALCLWIVGTLLYCGPTIYSVWTQGLAAFDLALFRWFLLYVLIGTPAAASSMLLIATNRNRALSILTVAHGALSILGALIITSEHSLHGTGIALVLTELLVFAIPVPLIVQKHLGHSIFEYIRGIYLPLGIGAATVLLFGSALANVASQSARLALVPTVLGILVSLMLWAWLSPSERLSISNLGRSLCSVCRRRDR